MPIERQQPFILNPREFLVRNSPFTINASPGFDLLGSNAAHTAPVANGVRTLLQDVGQFLSRVPLLRPGAIGKQVPDLRHAFGQASHHFLHRAKLLMQRRPELFGWVIFKEKSRRHDVDNGERGEVIAISPDASLLSIRKSNGKAVTIPLAEYDSLNLGYAQTIHSSQGTTVDYVYAIVGGSMAGRELTGVEASRARISTRFYADRIECGDDLEGLARDMSRELGKSLALEYLVEDEPPREQPNKTLTIPDFRLGSNHKAELPKEQPKQTLTIPNFRLTLNHTLD